MRRHDALVPAIHESSHDGDSLTDGLIISQAPVPVFKGNDIDTGLKPIVFSSIRSEKWVVD